jgi:hypothetical protein
MLYKILDLKIKGKQCLITCTNGIETFYDIPIQDKKIVRKNSKLYVSF